MINSTHYSSLTLAGHLFGIPIERERDHFATTFGGLIQFKLMNFYRFLVRTSYNSKVWSLFDGLKFIFNQGIWFDYLTQCRTHIEATQSARPSRRLFIFCIF